MKFQLETWKYVIPFHSHHLAFTMFENGMSFKVTEKNEESNQSRWEERNRILECVYSTAQQKKKKKI